MIFNLKIIKDHKTRNFIFFDNYQDAKLRVVMSKRI